jgi:hypothetical protein
MGLDILERIKGWMIIGWMDYQRDMDGGQSMGYEWIIDI